MTYLITNIINKVSSVFMLWKNRMLLLRINQVYENDPDPDDKKLLDAYKKSFRKLIEDEW